jgi:hypothetical protein
MERLLLLAAGFAVVRAWPSINSTTSKSFSASNTTTITKSSLIIFPSAQSGNSSTSASVQSASSNSPISPIYTPKPSSRPLTTKVSGPPTKSGNLTATPKASLYSTTSTLWSATTRTFREYKPPQKSTSPLETLSTRPESSSTDSWVQPDLSSSTPTLICKTVVGDDRWPADEVWEAALPGVTHFGVSGTNPHPNYYYAAGNRKDVQAAVDFAAKHNIRLSVITTGLDYMGR